MILAGQDPLEIGKQYTDYTIQDGQGVEHKSQPFVVIRTATAAEWEAYVLTQSITEDRLIRTRARMAAVAANGGAIYYYEISTD